MLRLKMWLPVKQEFKDQFLEVMRGLLGPVRAAPGCLDFSLFDIADHGAIILDQKWQDAASLERHIQNQTHRKLLIAMDLLREAPRIDLIGESGERHQVEPQELAGVLRKMRDRGPAGPSSQQRTALCAESLAAEITLDKLGNITGANGTFSRLWGYSSGHEVSGKPLAVLFESQKDAYNMLRTLDDEGAWEGLFVARRKDGSTFTASGLSSVLLNVDERMVGYLSSVMDATETRRAEQKLRAERDRAQKYLDIAGVMFLALDAQGNIALLNQKGCEILGYRPDEIIGSNWFDRCLSAGDRERVRTVFAGLMAGNARQAEYFENTVMTKDGRLRTIVWHNSTLKDDQGNIVGTLSSGEDITERREAEFRATQADQDLQRAQRVTKIGSWVWYTGSNQMKMSDELYSILGLKKEAGPPPIDLEAKSLHPNDRKLLEKKITDCLINQQPYSLDYRIYRQDTGELRHLHADTEIEKQADTGDLVIYGIVQDITDRKKAEEALRLSEEKFSATFHNSPNPMILVDVESRTALAANKAYLRMTGYRPEEIVDVPGKVGNLVTTPDLLERGFELAGAGQGVANWEVTLKTSNAGERTFLVSSEMFSGLDRSLAIVNLVDITERKQAEARVRAEKEFTDTALDAQLDTFFLFEPATGKAVRWNRAFRDASGYTDSEIAALPAPATYYSPADLERAAAFTEEVLNEGTGTIELELICKDGRKIPTEYRVSVIRDEQGEPEYLISIGRDVTERRRMESQLAQSDRLSSMGMLAAGVAHEINNPLAYVLYNLQSLAEEIPGLLDTLSRPGEHPAIDPSLADDLGGQVEEALEGAQRIREITRGLGTFSRVEENGLKPVHLTRVIEVAGNMAFNEIKYLACLVKDYGDTPAVMGSEGRLSQVFLNLLINAAHAIDEGDVENNQIRISTRVEGDQVVAEVSDTGRGIPSEHHEKLFEPFFTTKRIGLGSGLGLAISKNIVEGYGGSIQVRSEPGQGTTFTVRLPAGTVEKNAVEKHSDSATEAHVRGRILIVDDEENLRNSMTRLLQNHDTVEAASGTAARSIIEMDQDFDLILCDIMMPDMSGVGLHQWLTEEHPDLAKRVIFMTGGAFTPRTREYLSRVDNLNLEKPFDVDALISIANDLIQKAKSGKS